TGATVTVQAAAFDTAGNQSNVASLTFSVRDGIRPNLTVLTPVNNAQVLPGQTVTVMFDASDDVGLASVALVCSPALSGCESRPLSGDRLTHQTFSLVVPATMSAPATIDLLAVAVDTSGNTTEAGRTIRLVDTVRPTIANLHNASGSVRVVAGSTVT